MKKPKKFGVRVQWDEWYWLVTAKIDKTWPYGAGKTLSKAFTDLGRQIEDFEGFYAESESKEDRAMLADWRQYVPEKPKGKKKRGR